MAKDNQPLLKDVEKGTELTSWRNNEPDQTVTKTDSSVDRSNNVFIKPDSSWSKIPGLWPSSIDYEDCCIYRVPNVLREVNPNAYTPQMLLIGPLHHSQKAEAVKLFKTDSRFMDYINMEQHKIKYLNEIAIEDETIIEEFKRIINKNEQKIRASYAESTEWIKSQEFLDMILLDSLFILMFITKSNNMDDINIGDIIFDQPLLEATIFEDLMMLENQLPYFLLQELYEPFSVKYSNEQRRNQVTNIFASAGGNEDTLRDTVLKAFGLEGKIKKDVKFRHFTDLFRCVRVQILDQKTEDELVKTFGKAERIRDLCNVSELESAGVDFKAIVKDSKEEDGKNLALVIRFEDGILKLPCFTDEDTEILLRNMMALEQCHYPESAFVCNYMIFLDFLIDTDKDVDLLIKKGVIKNMSGQQKEVAEMVNKLCVEIVDMDSIYYKTAVDLNNHYKNKVKRSITTLKRVYFKDVWTGTATVAAALLLLFAIISTIASIFEATQKNHKSPSSATTKRI